MKAVVLAAGEGTRMWPLAITKPKHLLSIAGRPIISSIIKAIAECGIKEVLMVVGFKGELIQEALGDGGTYGIKIEYLRQHKRTGTASALRVAQDGVGKEPFLAMYGDLWANVSSIGGVIEKSRECSRVMGVVQMPNPSEYGVVELKGDRVVRIHEKPSGRKATEAWVNTGMYVLDDQVFQAIEETSRSKRNEYELTASLQRLLDQGQDIRAATIDRRDWMDVGRPWDILEANERTLMSFTHRVRGSVEPGAAMKGPVWLEESATIKSGCYIEGPVYIGERSRIGPNARIRPYTSIGNDVVVGTSCEIKNSVIMNGTKIPHLSYVGDSVIGENCNLAAGTITANIRLDGEPVMTNVKGRLLSSGRQKLGTIMGDDSQTGINASIMPGVKIGPYVLIGPGTTVYKDVPSGHAVFVRQTLISKQIKKRGIRKHHD
jgi:bifunctional UDP-N-acetylglucosamine pyrophosphorylase/glucosamine-1-phosphate N-acetyltransferase